MAWSMCDVLGAQTHSNETLKKEVITSILDIQGLVDWAEWSYWFCFGDLFIKN